MLLLPRSARANASLFLFGDFRDVEIVALLGVSLLLPPAKEAGSAGGLVDLLKHLLLESGSTMQGILVLNGHEVVVIARS